MMNDYRKYKALRNNINKPKYLEKLGISRSDAERILSMMRSGVSWNDAMYTVKG